VPRADAAVGVTRVQGGTVERPAEARAVWGLRVLAHVRELRHEFVHNHLGLQVPNFDAGRSGRAQPVPVGGEHESVDDVFGSEGVQALAFVQVPEHGHAVLAAGRAQRAVGRHGHGVEVAVVAGQVPLQGQVSQVPHLHFLVPAARHDHGRGLGRRKAHARHPLGVALVHHRVLALAQRVPQLDGFVAGARHDLAVVGRERHRQNVAGVAYEAAGSLARGNFPEAQGAVPRAGKRKLAVGGDHHAGHEVGVALEAPARETIVLLGAIDLPHHHRLVAGGREQHAVVLGRSSNGGHPVGVAHKGTTKSQLLTHFDIEV